jgi:hypothetical protein
MHNNSADGLQPPLILVVMKRKMDFNEINKWPKSWAGTDKDIEYGRKIMQLMKLFIIELLDSSYSPKTVKEHIDNLWLLGGHIIKLIMRRKEKKIPFFY